MRVTVTFTEAEKARIAKLYEDSPTAAEWGQWAARQIQAEVARLEEIALRAAADTKLKVDVAKTRAW